MKSIDLIWLIGSTDDDEAWDSMYDWARSDLITLLFEARDEIRELEWVRKELER